jgi:hypothetical protein
MHVTFVIFVFTPPPFGSSGLIKKDVAFFPSVFFLSLGFFAQCFYRVFGFWAFRNKGS